MIQSMTGFGSAEKGTFKVEVRSVNHRFLEMSLKLPQNLSGHEIPLRNLIKEKFSRGRFDIMVSVTDEGSVKVKINTGLARELYHALLFLKMELSLSGTIGVDTIAGFKELILSEEIKANTEPLYEAFCEALSGLEEMRLREGETIVRDMFLRLEQVGRLNGEIAQRCPAVISACRERFIERLNDLLGEARYDETRVLQEAAIMTERMDISEELTRIDSHLAQMKKVLSEGGTIGRKVEFLLQEFGREVNTIASKADDFRISNLSVEMKSELEKMREQAQNIQ